MSRTIVIAFANNKGGSGKTTTVSNIGCAMARMGKRVLLIDGDMQMNLTLSFFDEDKKESLKLCGSKSGRDCDKLALASLTPVIGKDGEVDYEESRLTLVGRKLYAQELSPECFIDKSVDASCYPNKDYHTVYVCEILEARGK